MSTKVTDYDCIAHRLIKAASNETSVRVRTMNHPEFTATAESPHTGNCIVNLNPDTDAPVGGELLVIDRNGHLLAAHFPEGENEWMTYHPFAYVEEVSEE